MAPCGVRESERRPAAEWALLAGVVLVGALARFYALGAKSLWLDETATMEIVARPLFDLLSEVARRDTHPPLYYVLLHAWMLGSSGGAHARAFSAGVGLATVAVVYMTARTLLPRAGALLAALLLALSAYQVYFAQEARHYALATLFVALSWWLLARLLTEERRRRWPLWLGLALANAAALYAFYYTAFAIAGQAVVLLVLWREGGRQRLAAWCVWQSVPAVLFAFYLPVVKHHLDLLRAVVPPGRYEGLRLGDLVTTGSQFTCGFLGRLAGGDGARAAAAALAALALVAGLCGVRRMRRAAALSLVWLLWPVAVVAFLPLKGHVYEPKHIAFAAPALALLPAIGLCALRGWWKTLPATLAVLLLGANALSLALYLRPTVQKEDWRAALTELADHAEPGDLLALNPRYVYLPYAYYYTPERLGRKCPALALAEIPEGGRPFRGGEHESARRVWELAVTSNVAAPNPRVAEMLRTCPILFHKPYEGLVGTVDLRLYDTAQPPQPAPGATPPAPP